MDGFTSCLIRPYNQRGQSWDRAGLPRPRPGPPHPHNLCLFKASPGNLLPVDTNAHDCSALHLVVHYNKNIKEYFGGFPGVSVGKESICNAGDCLQYRKPGSIPGSGSSPGGGNGSPFQYSCLENSWTEEPGGLQSTGWQRVRHNSGRS